MHVQNSFEGPEYEIDIKELDFTNSVEITKVKFILYLKSLLIPFKLADFFTRNVL